MEERVEPVLLEDVDIETRSGREGLSSAAEKSVP
jgi:hypothetical protein